MGKAGCLPKYPALTVGRMLHCRVGVLPEYLNQIMHSISFVMCANRTVTSRLTRKSIKYGALASHQTSNERKLDIECLVSHFVNINEGCYKHSNNVDLKHSAF